MFVVSLLSVPWLFLAPFLHSMTISHREIVTGFIYLVRNMQIFVGTFICLQLTFSPTFSLVRIIGVLSQDILDITANVFVEKPQKDIHNFVGTFSRVSAIFQSSLSAHSLLLLVYWLARNMYCFR